MYTLTHELPVVVPPTTFTVAPLQLSLAVGCVNTGEFGHSTVPLAPGVPIVGAVVSLTVMVWVQVAVLPLESVAV